MSAPVDVLAVLKEVRQQLPPGTQDQITFLRKENPIAGPADVAIAAIAELIEAGKALQEAMDTPEKGPFDSLTVKQFHEADARHRAALTACGAVLAAVRAQS